MRISVKNLFSKISKEYLYYLTPQEIKLFTYLSFDELKFFELDRKKEYKDYHVPCILQDKSLKLLDEVREKRKTMGFSFSYPTYFSLQPKDAVLTLKTVSYILCSLEDLDKNGKTVKDPMAVDKNNTPMSYAKKSTTFPYRRDK